VVDQPADAVQHCGLWFEGRGVAECPSQPAAIARNPRTVSAEGATTLNDSPAAASRFSTAS
jgi:hypothetical protein